MIFHWDSRDGDYALPVVWTNVRSIKLLAATIPATWHNIVEASIIFTESGGGQETGVLADGNYDVNSLLTAVGTAMTLASGLGRTYTASTSLVTGRSTIAASAGTVSIDFVGACDVLRIPLGYGSLASGASTASLASLVSPQVARAAPFDCLYITSDTLARQGIDQSASRALAIGQGGQSLNGVVARVPLAVNPYEIAEWEPRNPVDIKIATKMIDKIGFTLRRGDTGAALSLNGYDWTLTLLVE
jgi:hypothetical protein